MRALVTGGTGFLGGRLAVLLRDRGWDVIITGRNATVGKARGRPGVTFVPADLAETKDLESIFHGVDYVFHCAALTKPRGAYDLFYRANVIATRNVVAACLRNGVRRLIHISSPSIYMENRHRLGIRENEPLPVRFASPYGKTKWLSELEVGAGVDRGLEAVILRPQAIFGPGDTVLFPRLLRIVGNRSLPLIEGGTTMIDITYVDNVVDACLAAVHAGTGAIGNSYNITNGEPARLIDILKTVFETLGIQARVRSVPFRLALAAAGMSELWYAVTRPGLDPPLTRYAVAALGRSRTLCIERAQKDLGYEPCVSIAEGIKRFAAWWKEQNGAPELF